MFKHFHIFRIQGFFSQFLIVLLFVRIMIDYPEQLERMKGIADKRVKAADTANKEPVVNSV